MTPAVGTGYRVYVDDASNFQIDDMIVIFKLALTAGSGNLTGRVTATNTSGADYIEFECVNALPSTIINSGGGLAGNEGRDVYLIGSAFAEGSRSRTGRNKFPLTVENCAQIHKNAFELTRNALKAPTNYNKSGHYQKALKDNGIDHLVGLEYTALFGKRLLTGTDTDPDTGSTVSRYFSGGLLWFLEQWEKADSIYRGGSGATAITSNTDNDKRIVSVGGTLTKSRYNQWLQQLFRVTQDKGYEKICLCGATFISTINSLFERDRVVQTTLEEPGTKARFTVYSHQTLFGTVHYKTHPLFTEDPDLTDSGLFLDLGNLRYRPLTDSDTKFLKRRTENDRDGGKWEWITEAGLELKYPESCGFLKDATAAG